MKYIIVFKLVYFWKSYSVNRYIYFSCLLFNSKGLVICKKIIIFVKLWILRKFSECEGFSLCVFRDLIIRLILRNSCL